MSEQAASAKAKAETGKTARNSKKSSSDTPKASLNVQELRELAELVNEHGFTEFEFENENIRIRLSKMSAPQIVQAVQPVASSAPFAVAPQQTLTPAEIAPVESAADADEALYKITSPIV